MAEEFDPYHKWLAIPPEQQPPNYYQLLGVADFEEDLGVIECLADQRMAFVRSMQTGRYSELSQNVLNELAAARVCLLNETKRVAYDAQLREQMDGGVSDAFNQLPQDGFTAVPVRPARLGGRRRSWLVPAVSLAASALVLLIVIAYVLSDTGNPEAGTQADQRGARDDRRGGLPVSSHPSAPRTGELPDADRPVRAPDPEAGPPGADPALAPDRGPVAAIAPQPDEWLDLLALVDLKKHVVSGQWQRRGSEIHVEHATLGEEWRFMVPVAVAGSYRLHVEFTRLSGNNVHVQLPVGDRGCTLILGGWYNKFSGLHLIDGVKARDNPTARRAGIADGHRYALDVDVDVSDAQAAVSVRLDGEPYLQWQGAIGALSVHELLTMPVPGTMGFGATNNTTLVLHAARLHVTSGRARVLKD